MKTNPNPRRVQASFGRETRFGVCPRFDTHARQRAVERLKSRLLEPLLDTAESAPLRRHLELAANEAAAVAWTTSFPLLTFPVLFEEKSAEVYQYTARQEAVHEATEAMADALA